jgi:hypothetical protein
MFARLFCSNLIVLIIMGNTVSCPDHYLNPDKVVQIDVSAILNARSVTTFSKGKLISWTTGIDKENGYLTMAAASFAGALASIQIEKCIWKITYDAVSKSFYGK